MTSADCPPTEALSCEALAGIIDTAMDAIVTADAAQRIVLFNTAAERMFGRTAGEMLGQPLGVLMPERFREAHRRHTDAFGGGHFSRRSMGDRGAIHGLRANGEEFPIEAAISRSGAGGHTLCTVVLRDISERVQSQRKLLQLSRIHAVLSEINSLIVRTRDRRELLDAACRIAVEQGTFAAAWIGLMNKDSGEVTLTAWAGPCSAHIAHDPAFARARLLDTGGLAGRAVATRAPALAAGIADGALPRCQEVLGCGYHSLIALPLGVADTSTVGVLELFSNERALIDRDGELALLTELADDISFALEHIADEEKLHYLAYYDTLTGLANRTLLHDRLEQALRAALQNGTKVALLAADIKAFRKINETLGRSGGDIVLRELASRFRRLAPDPKSIARIGSDHFAAVISDFKADSELGHRIEETIEGLTSAPFRAGAELIHLAIRAGIAVFPSDGQDADTLFKNAEAAQRKCKLSADRYLLYQPEMNASVAETLLLENKLKGALEKQQFVLHYQPKIRASDGRIGGLEALIRWNDPGSGMVPPAKFIPLLEETGMIAEVGLWVIRQALAEHSAWLAQGLDPPRIAVNVSAVQMRRKDFLEQVRAALGAGRAEALELEITESVMMHDIEDNIRKLHALREMGFTLSIDDFGTGYSSLAYLTRLPVNALKIDRSFVTGMTDDANSMSIVSTILSMAQSLKLTVIAEGVETEEQARFLKLLRCDELQGHLFGKPVPADEMARRLGSARLAARGPAGRCNPAPRSVSARTA